MFNVHIKLRKEVMQFVNKQGEDVKLSGIRVILGPRIEKFFALENLSNGTKSNLELLGYTNPNLVQFYYNSNAGAEMTLIETVDRKKSIPVKEDLSIKEIYTNSENEL